MNEFIGKITVIIPSYQPDGKLLEVVKGLVEKGFEDIILVDDGSGESYAPIFGEAALFKEITLLTHPENRGKGCALKTAFDCCIKERPNCSGVVTVDGDNQHHVDDIYACCEKNEGKTGPCDPGGEGFFCKGSAFPEPFRKCPDKRSVSFCVRH